LSSEPASTVRDTYDGTAQEEWQAVSGELDVWGNEIDPAYPTLGLEVDNGLDPEPEPPVKKAWRDMSKAEKEEAFEQYSAEKTQKALVVFEAIKQSLVTKEEPFPVTDDMLTDYFNVDSRYRTQWLSRKIKDLPQCVENTDYIVSHNFVENPSGGRPKTCYRFSRNMAKHIGLIDRSVKGHELRDKIIALEEEVQQAVQAGFVPGLSEHALANLMAQSQQGFLMVMERLNTQADESRDRHLQFMAQLEQSTAAHREALQSMVSTVQKLAEARVPKKESKVAMIFNMLKRVDPYPDREGRIAVYKKSQEVARREGQPYERIQLPGWKFATDHTTVPVFKQAVKELGLTLV
jgi:phage anti-repressor protein